MPRIAGGRVVLALAAAAALAAAGHKALWPTITLVTRDSRPRPPEPPQSQGILAEPPERAWEPSDNVRGMEGAGPAAADHGPPVSTAMPEDAAPRPKRAPGRGARPLDLEGLCRKILACRGAHCPKPPILCLPWSKGRTEPATDSRIRKPGKETP